MDAQLRPRRYRAFISYSHADRADARWLHRRLEGYKLPARLVGGSGPRGPIPASLAPIFKDREDLPAANDLTAEVRGALAASDCLIVLCTPAAAASCYVGQEVAQFRSQYPDRPVLAALFDGEPGEAFPAALRNDAVEPLAADFRKTGDGRRLALLKLAAGIAGVDLDALVQRDAQRRLRRVMAVTVAAVIAMLAMGLLTIFALKSRAEAERQRTQAEGLVEFMLTDLRTRLKGVGRLDVLASANQRAMAYYAAQDLARLGADSLERRARILQAIGEDNEKRGDLDAAQRGYREAKRITAALLAADPGNPDRIFSDAQSDYWSGHIDERRGNFAAAARAYERYRADARRLITAAPQSAKYMTEMAYAENNIGIVQLNGLKRPAAAAAAFTRAIHWFEAATRRDAGNADLRYELANAHGWLADALFADGAFPGARAERLRDRSIRTALAADDPRNLRYRQATIVTDRALARIDRELGERRRAAATLAGAAAASAALVALEPANIDWRDQAARIGCDRARLALDAGDLAAARALLLAARETLAGPGGAKPADSDRREVANAITELLATTSPNPRNHHKGDRSHDFAVH